MVIGNIKNKISNFQNLFNIPAKVNADISEEELCKLLNTNLDALKAFEEGYERYSESQGLSDNLFRINSRQVAEIKEGMLTDVPAELQDVVEKIVSDLVSQTIMYSYDGKRSIVFDYRRDLSQSRRVTAEEIQALPKNKQPDLTGSMIKRDIPGSGISLVAMWDEYQKANNPNLKKAIYNHFRQGLDSLDLDPITYEMIDQNPISMGFWLPRIVDAVSSEGFFKIPATKIIKVPISILQLTRLDYMSLSRTTLDIVDEYCYRVFGLQTDKDYFIKTGTYSSKFDFRNARVSGAKEIKELGEYLLFIHWQALQMAHYDLSGRNQPVIYGVSTTTEWVVRDFISDVENNLTIYHGLPLHTEYRAFVDFDTNEVLGIHPYWDAKTVKRHFEKTAPYDPDAFHDHITYSANEEKLSSRYEANKDAVIKHLQTILPNIDLEGQWSVDIMQNGKDFWLIDMASAEHSAYYDEVVPPSLRRPSEEAWLPDLGILSKNDA